MITECPHCHCRVLPKNDGTCPSCRRDTADRRGTDPNMTSVTLREHEPLPPLCLRCGRSTEHRKLVKQSTRRGGDSWFVQAFRVLAVPLFHADWNTPSREDVKSWVSLRVPVCETCAALGELEPCYVDFDDYTMMFVGHRTFRKRLSETRRQVR